MYKSEQLANSIKDLILTGNLEVNTRLPSLRDQVQRSGFSLMTVLNAYQTLEAQGLIYSIEKSGYFVAQRSKKTKNNPPVLALTEHIDMNALVFNYLKSIQGKDIVPLGSAFPDPLLLNPTKLIQIMAQLSRHQHNYYQQHNLPPGNLELRQLIAQRYCMQGIPTDADDIVITSGCLDALNLSLQALTQPGDYILLQETIFYGAWQVAERLGLKVVTLPEHPIDGFDLDAFEHALQHYPIKVCWFMLNCHNPIGFTVSTSIKAKIAQLIDRYQVYLIEDDVYEELYGHGGKPLPMKYFDQNHRVMHCSSFSKTLGAGFRLGWVHAAQFSEKIQHQQLMSTVSANSLMQNALVEFLSGHHYEKHLRQLRRNLQKNKKNFVDYLTQHLPQNCQLYVYEGGYFLWLHLPSHINSLELYQHLIQQKIGIAPSALFQLRSDKHHALRINCSFTWSDEISRGLSLMIAYIKQAYCKKNIGDPTSR